MILVIDIRINCQDELTNNNIYYPFYDGKSGSYEPAGSNSPNKSMIIRALYP